MAKAIWRRCGGGRSRCTAWSRWSPRGGKVPKAKDADAESKKAAHEARRAQLAKEKKAAQAAADAKKTPEEKELEAKVEAQGKRLAAIKKGLEEGDAEKEMSVAKSLKTELAELRKRLKGTTIKW